MSCSGPPSSTSAGESAQGRFGGAKSISSDQYFGREHSEVSGKTSSCFTQERVIPLIFLFIARLIIVL